MFWISLGATKSVDSWPAGSEQRQLDNLTLRQLCDTSTLPVFCGDRSVLCCADLRKCFYQIRHGHRLLATKDVRSGQHCQVNQKWTAFTSRSSEMPNATNATYQHQDGEVATEDLEIMLKYMGCILASTHDAHMDAHMWGVGTFASATLDFAPLCFRFQFANILNSEAMRHFAEGWGRQVGARNV